MKVLLVAVVLLLGTCHAQSVTSQGGRVSGHAGNGTTLRDHHIIDPKKDKSFLKKCNPETDACSYQRDCVEDKNADNEFVCLHKSLLPHFSARDAWTVVTIFMGTMLAASAGIGGGGLNVPIYMLITGFLIQEAVPLSHATVFGNSVAQLVVNLRQRHPLVGGLGKPLIDFYVPLVLLPSQLGGNNLGVLFEPMIPPNVLVLLAECLLAYATFRVFSKGMTMWRQERAAARLQASGDDEKASKVSEVSKHSEPYFGIYHEVKDEQDLECAVGLVQDMSLEEKEKRTKQILEAESRAPWPSIGLMFVFWCLFAAGYVGLKEFGKCTAGYWGVLAAMYPILVVFVVIGVKLVKMHKEERDAVGLPPVEGNIDWNSTKVIVGPAAACGVGLVAGLLGLGGGELMAPLLLELGMIPKVASATSAYMIIWTTSSNIVHYSVGGDLPAGYTILFCLLGFVGGLIGRFMAIHITSKYNCQSVIALSLGFVLLLSMVLLAYRVATEDSDHPWWPFHGMC
eukprot:Sspe_Gene.59695::Locus_32799_Transcript_1_9_Confidence_0.400_Length_1670::g.59695::m.59695